MGHGMPIMISVSAGELIDRMTILKIKAEYFRDAEKLDHVRQELEMLRTVWKQTIEPSPQLMEITNQLESINRELWRIEDALRLCDREKDFGPEFVELARSVYRNNDRRCAVEATDQRTGRIETRGREIVYPLLTTVGGRRWPQFPRHWRRRSSTIKAAGCKLPSRSIGRFSPSRRSTRGAPLSRRDRLPSGQTRGCRRVHRTGDRPERQ